LAITFLAGAFLAMAFTAFFAGLGAGFFVSFVMNFLMMLFDAAGFFAGFLLAMRSLADVVARPGPRPMVKRLCIFPEQTQGFPYEFIPIMATSLAAAHIASSNHHISRPLHLIRYDQPKSY
jgi:hypothetical protein